MSKSTRSLKIFLWMTAAAHCRVTESCSSRMLPRSRFFHFPAHKENNVKLAFYLLVLCCYCFQITNCKTFSFIQRRFRSLTDNRPYSTALIFADFSPPLCFIPAFLIISSEQMHLMVLNIKYGIHTAGRGVDPIYNIIMDPILEQRESPDLSCCRAAAPGGRGCRC